LGDEGPWSVERKYTDESKGGREMSSLLIAVAKATANVSEGLFKRNKSEKIAVVYKSLV